MLLKVPHALYHRAACVWLPSSVGMHGPPGVVHGLKLKRLYCQTMLDL